MDAHRRVSLGVAAALLAAALTFGTLASRSELSGDAVGQMRRAEERFAALAAPGARRHDGDILALGYLERLRLGFGSPFRLIDLALADPRLDDSTRARVSWALLGRLREGAAYHVDPAALDGLTAVDSGAPPVGSAHLALIERTIRDASDPRAGELAVRLGYTLPAAERTTAGDGVRPAAEAAALVRDRLLAAGDERTVFERARSERISALEAVRTLRTERGLEVERPASLPLGPELEAEAMRLAPRVLAAIRGISAPAALRDQGSMSLLDDAARTRLAALGASLPPQAPIAIALLGHPDALPGLSDGIAVARAPLVRRPPNEETLVAAAVPAQPTDDVTVRRERAAVVMRAAVQLRALAQEAPWFPGMPSPSAGDLASDLGIASVRFDAGVPERWRGYYLTMLATSIRDMQTVLGGLSVDGLNVRFVAGPLPESALALHDPRSRTLRLSIVSSSGTLAHELSHDLDWQTARRLYPRSGGYGTDHAARDERGLLGLSVRGMAAARLGDTSRSSRPAELFARDMDWLVATTLAQAGRSNGHLSAAQDALLTGYAGVEPRELLGGGGPSLVAAVEEMAYLDESASQSFLARWSDPTADPYTLLLQVLSVQAGRRSDRFTPRFAPPVELAAVTPAACRTAGDLTGLDDARRTLVSAALDARALGLVRRWAEWFTPERRPAWASSVLRAAPWSPAEGERIVARTRARLAAQLEDASASGRGGLGAVVMFRSGLACGASR